MKRFFQILNKTFFLCACAIVLFYGISHAEEAATAASPWDALADQMVNPPEGEPAAATFGGTLRFIAEQNSQYFWRLRFSGVISPTEAVEENRIGEVRAVLYDGVSTVLEQKIRGRDDGAFAWQPDGYDPIQITFSTPMQLENPSLQIITSVDGKDIKSNIRSVSFIQSTANPSPTK